MMLTSPALSGGRLGAPETNRPTSLCVRRAARAGADAQRAAPRPRPRPGRDTGVKPRADERSLLSSSGQLPWRARRGLGGGRVRDDVGDQRRRRRERRAGAAARLAAAARRRAGAGGGRAPARAAGRPPPRRGCAPARRLHAARCLEQARGRVGAGVEQRRPRSARRSRGAHALPGREQVVGQLVAELGRGLEALARVLLSAWRTMRSSAGGRSAPYLSSRSSFTSRTLSSTSRSAGAENSRRPVSSSASTHADREQIAARVDRLARRPARATCSRTCPSASRPASSIRGAARARCRSRPASRRRAST